MFAHTVPPFHSLWTRLRPVWYGVMLCVLLAPFSPNSLADPQLAKINRVKAAFVYNIAKFVSWPPSAQGARPGSFMICFYREDFLGRGFDSIHGKRIQERHVEKTLIDTVSADAPCDAVLIPASQLGHYQLEAAHSDAHPRLTIADLTNANTPGTARYTAMVNLVRQGASIAFEVNLEQVQGSHLTMSSELLKLARIISPPQSETQ